MCQNDRQKHSSRLLLSGKAISGGYFMNGKSIQYLKFITAMVLLGFNGWLAAHISLSSAEIVFVRTLIGGLMLLVIVLLRRSFDVSAFKADLTGIVGSGLFLGLNWISLFSAYQYAGVSLATLTNYCGPILVIALSPVLFREKLSLNRIAAVLLVAIGMVCISGSIDRSGDVGKGMIFGAAAALSYAGLIIFNKRITHTGGMEAAMCELLIAFLVVTVDLLCTTGLPHLHGGSELWYLAVIGFVNTGLCYHLYCSSLQQLPGQTVALLCYIDPLTALFVSGVLLGEHLGAVQLIGAVLILGGAMLGEIVRRKDPPERKHQV